MPKRLTLATTVLAAFLLTACGPDATGNSAASAPSTASSRTQPSTPGSSSAAPAGLSPEDVCALVSLADMGHATSYTFTSTKASTSGDVSVCTYIGAGADGYSSPKTYLEYQPTGKTLIEYTKAKGVAVDGLGAAAYYFQTAGQLSVELPGTASFTIYVMDVRVHGGDPKAAAVEIARVAVPKLLHG
jgi:hypothetical protein